MRFLILLKTFQRLGYAVQTQAVPASIVQHIATATNLTVSQRELAHYDAAVTRRRHLSLIRDYLHLHAYSPTAKTVMEEAIRTAAATKQDLADLINVAIEELVRQRFELPAFSTFTRTAQQIRAQVTTTFYQQVYHRLNPASRQQLDALLTIVAPNANHLVANCLIFYNVFEISRILNELRQEGYPLDADAVAALSPYWTQHVNRFGVYDLD
jgi:hypothetical protein